MYTIRVTPEGRLHAEASGRLPTREALRLISQGFALADAGALTDLLVDVRTVERGPAQWLLLAAVIASRMEEPMRLAVVAGRRQEAIVRRILRYTGLRGRAAAFLDEDAALRWFGERFRERQLAGEGTRRAAAPAFERTAESDVRPKAG